MLYLTWLPFLGLIWWYKFAKNLIKDPDRHHSFDVFREPTGSQDIHRLSLPSDQNIDPTSVVRPSRYTKKQYPDTKRGTSMFLTSMAPGDHHRAAKMESYCKIGLPKSPLTECIDDYNFHVWNLHPNSTFF